LGANAKLRAAAIGRTGGGDFGHGLHLAFLDLHNVDMVAVADPDEAGRKRAADASGAARAYADYAEMLVEEHPDIVCVCPRWVDCHEDMLLACIEAGCHVYCEKPLAADLSSADRIVSGAEKAGVKVAVAHQAVYLPQLKALKRMLDTGEIGPVYALQAFGKQDHRGGGEDMMVLGTHLFNIMRYLAGDVAWMFSQVTDSGREIGPADVREGHEPIGPIAGDSVYSYFAFESGVSGHFSSRADQPGGSRRYGMDILGRNGRIAFRGGAAESLSVYPHGVWSPGDSAQAWKPVDVDQLPLREGNRLAVQDLVECIETGREPVSSARDARAALEMILGAYES